MANTNDTIQGDRSIKVYDTDVQLSIISDSTQGNTDIIDRSSNNYSITTVVTGAPYHDATDPKFNNTAIYFDGYSVINADSSFTGRLQATDDWTITTWLKPSILPADPTSQYYLNKTVGTNGNDSEWLLYIANGDGIQAHFTNTSSSRYFVYSGAERLINDWNYIEYTRVGDTIYSFLNGILDYSIDVTGVILKSGLRLLALGGINKSGDSTFGRFDGWLDDIQLTYTPGHTGNYTIPDTPTSDPGTSDHNIVNYDAVDTMPEISYLQEEEPNMMTLTRTASGVISGGDVVILNENGTASIGIKDPDTLSVATSAEEYNEYTVDSVYDPDTERLIVATGARYGVSNGTRAYTVSISGDTPIYGVLNEFDASTDAVIDMAIAYDHVNQKVIIAYWYYLGGPGVRYVIAGDIIPHGSDPTQDSLSFGTRVTVDTSTAVIKNNELVYDEVTGLTVLISTHADGLHVIPLTISGTTITLGQDSLVDSSTVRYVSSTYDPVHDQIVCMYNTSTSVSYSLMTVTTTGAPSAAYVDWSTPEQFSTTSIDWNKLIYDPVNDKLVFIGVVLDMVVMIGESNGESITFGEEIDIDDCDAHLYSPKDIAYDSGDGKFVILFSETTTFYLKSVVFNVNSDNTINTWPSTVLVSESTVGWGLDIGYYPITGTHLLTYNSGPAGSLTHNRVYDVKLGKYTSTNILGISQNTASDGEDCIVGRYGFLDETQTGLTPNRQYYIDDLGNLTTDNRGQYVGYAVSNTKLIVKA